MRRISLLLAFSIALAAPRPAPADLPLTVGDIIVTDISQNAIFQVDPSTGALTVITSGGLLDTPRDVAVHPSHQYLYVTESNLQDAVIRIDLRDPANIVQQVITRDGFFSSPRGIVIHASGDLLVSDPFDARVFRVNLMSGSQSVFAASNGASTSFRFPDFLELDPTGRLLVTDAPAGDDKFLHRVEAIGGTPSLLSTGQNFLFPRGVAVESDGKILVADSLARAVIRVDPDSGSGANQSSVASGGSLLSPRDIAVEPNGNIVVADQAAKAVFRIHPQSGALSTVSSGGNLQSPLGIAVVREIVDFVPNGVLAADSGAGTVVRVAPNGSTELLVPVGALTSPVAVARTQPAAIWNDAILVADAVGLRAIDAMGVVTEVAPLPNLTGIAVDAAGDLLVTDPAQDAVVRITPGAPPTLTPLPEDEDSACDLTDPVAIAIDRDGLLVVATTSTDESSDPPEEHGRVLRIHPITGACRIVSQHSNLHRIRGLAIDANGDVLIADDASPASPTESIVDSVLRIDAQSEQLSFTASSVAGSFSSLQGIAVDGNRDLIVSDQGTAVDANLQEILRIDPLAPATQPQLASGPPFVTIRGIALDAPPPAFPLADDDSDLFGDSVDNCANQSNPDQSDWDIDTLGDICDPDDDNDLDLDVADNCPFVANSDQLDTDSDGLGDRCDNCDNTASPDQLDTNNDGQGDVCDDDDDGDGILDIADNCRIVINPDQADLNQEGFGNLCDADLNDDGFTGAPDFAILRPCLFPPANSGPPPTSNWNPKCDLTSDGVVGAPDLAILMKELRTAPGPSGLACAGTAPCPAPP